MQYGHGDMFFRRIEADEVPEALREKLEAGQERRVVIAEGELTGHVHLLTSDEPVGFVRETDEVAYALLRDAGLLEHEEHGERIIEPGWYEIPTERDYDPALYARQVID